MANATASVQLNVTGNAQQQLQKTQKSVENLQKSFGNLKNIVGGIAIGALITNMFRAADAITDLSDATNLSVSSIIALRQAFQASGGDAEGAEQAILKLYDSIQNAADGNDKLITSFQKVGVTLQDLGTLSEEEIKNKVIRGLGQLGNNAQAVSIKMDLMGKSARGVDFKNVADQFDELKKKAKETEPGIIAAGKIFDNLGKFRSDFGAALAKEFSGVLVTLQKLTSNTESLAKSMAELVKIISVLGASFLIFNKVIPYIKSLGDAIFLTGAAGKFMSSQFKNIFVNLKGFIANISAFTLSLINLKNAFTLTAGRAGGLKSLAAAMLNVLRIGLRFAGLIGIIIGVTQALNFLIKTITGFDVLDWLAEKLSKVGEKFKEFLAYIGIDLFKDVNQGAVETVDNLEEIESKAASTRDRLAEIRKENKKFLVSVQEITDEYKDQNNQRLESLANDIKYLSMTEAQIAADKNRIEIHKEFIDTLDELAQKRREALEDPSKGETVAKQIDAEIAKVQEAAVIAQTESAKKIKTYYNEIQAIKDQKDAIEELGRAFSQANALQELEEELSLIGLSTDELEKQRAVLEAQRVLREQMQVLAKQLLELDIERTRIGEDAYNRERQRIIAQMNDAQALAEAKIAAKEREIQKITELENSYIEGVKKALESMADQYKPINVAQEAITKGFDKIGDAVSEFVETGKFKFSDFARSVLADLAKMLAKAALFKALQAGLSFFGLGLPGLAEGGPAKKGQPYIVGEKGPELFVPRESGTVVPNNKMNDTEGSRMVNAPVTNNYITNNINALDAKSVAQLFAENRKALLGSVRTAEKELPYRA